MGAAQVHPGLESLGYKTDTYHSGEGGQAFQQRNKIFTPPTRGLARSALDAAISVLPTQSQEN